MAKKLDLDEFITRARMVHGDKYDYSDSVYVDMKTPLLIKCPVHGVFSKSPNNHLKGQGCKKCSHEKLSKERIGKPHKNDRKLVKGVGFFDSPLSSHDHEVLTPDRMWRSMLSRCYSKKYQEKEPSYKGCWVCEKWLYFSNFKKWFDDPTNGYREGYHLDKDILVKGNKVYSPETCCFVPRVTNNLLVSGKKNKGKYPIGVCKRGGRFTTSLSAGNKRLFLGSFITLEEAFNAYKGAKEKHIKEVAQEYFGKGMITEKVYNALMNYKVEFND